MPKGRRRPIGGGRHRGRYRFPDKPGGTNGPITTSHTLIRVRYPAACPCGELISRGDYAGYRDGTLVCAPCWKPPEKPEHPHANCTETTCPHTRIDPILGILQQPPTQ